MSPGGDHSRTKQVSFRLDITLRGADGGPVVKTDPLKGVDLNLLIDALRFFFCVVKMLQIY